MAPHAELAPSVNGHAVAEPAVSTQVNGPRSHTCTTQPKVSATSLLTRTTPSDDLHDIVCVGFGPAALAIAVAVHDALESGELTRPPRVCFLERQQQFGWHSGMQIPGATMQISWIKDLATIRNPRSQFTFLNYLHCQKRLLPFSDLGTFLPLRREYEDYMRWCAAAFQDVVEYGQSAVEIEPVAIDASSRAVNVFGVTIQNVLTGKYEHRVARHVIVAAGGQPSLPPVLPQQHPNVIHSSSYMHQIYRMLPDRDCPYRIAVIGAGQSAAETFNDLHSRYPRSQTRLIIKGAALKPSDDSPFVNAIFDPARTDGVYDTAPDVRASDIAAARDTNYNVVRISLLEHIYASLYEQRLDHKDERDWPHQILNFREVTGADISYGRDASLILKLRNTVPLHAGGSAALDEVLPCDAVVVATGYQRNAHTSLMKKCEELRAKASQKQDDWTVERDYRVRFDKDKVEPDAGVWLQGCCEDTHGLSDTLLSVLATRAGEVVQSIFADDSNQDNGHTNGANGHLEPECTCR